MEQNKKQDETVFLSTECGEIEGRKQDGVLTFKGIRYATCGRWEYPRLTEHWDGVYNAKEFGDGCIQPRAFHPEENNTEPEKLFYYHEFREGLSLHYQEDALFLNIWAPEKATKAPVIIFIHGGAFLGGCGHEKPMCPESWAKRGVIGVTINYRLGAFGFLHFEEVLRECGHTGNYGLYDQKAAVEWIYRNISAFGGDPENITIMGQSAGAMSVNWQCCDQSGNSRFHRAVMLSGGGCGFMEEAPYSQQDALEVGDRVMEKLGCASLRELKEKEASDIISAAFLVMRETQRGLEIFSPMPDELDYPENISTALENGHVKNIPYLLCSTSEDLWPEGLMKSARAWADSMKKSGNESVYQARFSRRLPGDDQGAFHSSDLWYWFGSLEKSWRPFEDYDRKLSEAMVDYLTAFARNGNPNAGKLPEWTAVCTGPGSYMEFGDTKFTVRKG